MNERVKEIRKAHELTQREFGSRLGVKDTAISKIEKGDNGLTEQMILAICRVFNVNEEWLRTGEGEMEAEYDDANIRAVINTYNLGMWDDILRAVCSFPEDKRNAANEVITHLARAVLDGKITQVKNGVVNEIGHANIDGEVREGLIDQAVAVFGSILPEMVNAPPPAPKPSRLQALKNETDVEFSSDTLMEESAPVLSDDELLAQAKEEAALMTEKIAQELYLEKRRVQSTSTSLKSGAV